MNEKRNKLLIFGVAAALILFVIAAAIFVSRLPLESRTLDVRFEVSDKLGADLNDSALTFGKLFPGSSAVRKLEVANNRNFPVEIEFFASEEIASFLIAENKTLPAGENFSIPITLIIPKEMPYGNYSGKLRMVVTKFREEK